MEHLIKRADKWYELQPKITTENGKITILGDTNIQIGREIANRP